MKMTRNEDAVSPVIGVILMVAVTVILAAVIAAFVFGMSGNIQKSHVVAATSQVIGGNIVVTYQGGQDHDQLIVSQPLNATFTDATGTAITTGVSPFPSTISVGSTAQVAKPTDGSKIHIVVTGKFKDGASSVILDTQN